MSKVRIIFGSETGNTESIAELLAKCLTEKGHEVVCESAANVKAKDLAVGYDCVLLGASVWGIDTIELQSDFDELAQSFGDMGLTKGAAFASGDTAFELYCAAVDFVEEEFNKLGVEILLEGLRVEGHAADNKGQIEEWANALAEKL